MCVTSSMAITPSIGANNYAKGIARLCIQDMMYPGSNSWVFQNACYFNYLPEWYTSGLASYIGESWCRIVCRICRPNGNGTFKNLTKVCPEDSVRRAAFWHYIALTYGKPTIPNILYSPVSNHSGEAGFSYVIGKSFTHVMEGGSILSLLLQEKFSSRFLDNKDHNLPLKQERTGFIIISRRYTKQISGPACYDLGLVQSEEYWIEKTS